MFKHTVYLSKCVLIRILACIFLMQAMSGGIWAPYKELASVVNQAILKKQPDAFYSLEAILKKHKTDFISLLKNPVRH